MMPSTKHLPDDHCGKLHHDALAVVLTTSVAIQQVALCNSKAATVVAVLQ